MIIYKNKKLIIPNGLGLNTDGIIPSDEYATKVYVNEKVGKLAGSVYTKEESDAKYALKGEGGEGTTPAEVRAIVEGYGFAKESDIPTVPENVSAFTNDAGYLTEHQSLDEYATKEYVNTKVDGIVDNIYTKEEVDELVDDKISEQKFKTINNQSILGEGNIEVGGEGGGVTIEEVDNEINIKLVGYATEQWVVGTLSPYATKDEIPSLNGYATETWVEGKGYITEIPSGYVTETELDSKGYLTEIPSEYVTDSELEQKGYLTEIPSEYAKKTDIPTVPTNVSAFTNDAGYLTQHQSLEGYATKEYVDEKIAEIPTDDYVLKKDIVQSTGTSTTAVMSQKACTDTFAKVQKLTQAKYDALETKDNNTIYIING